MVELGRAMQEYLLLKNGLNARPEHLVPHTTGLVLQFPNENPRADMPARIKLAMLTAELLKQGVEHIALVNPLDRPLETSILFDLAGISLEEEHQKRISFLPTPGASTRLFLRDDVLMGTDVYNNPVVGTSLARTAFVKNGSSVQASAFQQKFGTRPLRLPFYFENGNLTPTQNHLLALRDTIDINKAMLSGLQKRAFSTSETRSLLTSALAASNNKELVVLDEELGFDGPDQTIYHQDLALAVTVDDFGQEQILIASPEKAKSILEQNGFTRPGKPFDVNQWMAANGYIGPSEVEEQVEVIIASVGNLGLQTRELRRYLTEFYEAPLQDLRAVGTQLNNFFQPKNYDPLRRYIEILERRLSKLGFGSRIHETPSLLWATEYKAPDYLDPESSDHYEAPIYAPVNGITYNYPGKPRRFITGAGIKLFDRDVEKTINQLGLTYVPSITTFNFGRIGAGLHCLAIPM